MRIPAITPEKKSGKMAYKDNFSKPEVSFKSREIFDIGASNKGGSLKILVQDNNGKDLFEYTGVLNPDTQGFVDNKDFIKRVATAVDVGSLMERDIEKISKQLEQNHLLDAERNKMIKDLTKLKQNSAIWNALSPEEKALKGLVVMLPGTVQGKKALFMANLKTLDGKSLTDVSLDEIIPEIKAMGKIELASSFNAATDFVPCKDLAGTGIGIAQKIFQHPEYSQRASKGFHAVAVQTGGGFGAVDIKMKEDAIVDIETNESSHDLYFDPKSGKEKRLGKLGASTGSVIENYAKGLGLQDAELIKTLTDTGVAQMATQDQVKFDNVKHSKAIDTLLKTNLYEVVNKNSENTILKIKKESIPQFNKASKEAVEAYADTLALHAITRINKGANLYVVSGPLAMGLDERVKQSKDLFEANGMKDLILKFIDKRVGTDDTCNRLRKANNFDVVCDKAVSLSNNTTGGSALLSDGTITLARRGEWIRLPIDALKNGFAGAKKKKRNAIQRLYDKIEKVKLPNTAKILIAASAFGLAAYALLSKGNNKPKFINKQK